MKKLFMIVSTPFWMVNLDFVPRFDLQPVGDFSALRQECTDFERTVVFETDATAFDFFRRKSAIFFKVADEPQARRDISLSADVAALENLELVPKRKSLSTQATQLGLGSAGAHIETHANGTFLKVTGMDLACDLINHSLEIKARVPIKAGPSHDKLIELMEKFEAIEKLVLMARADEDPRLGVLHLGYGLNEDDLKLVFEKLVNPDTLELSEHWKYFGGVPSIKYDVSKEAGLVDVTLAVPYMNESEIKHLEKKLSPFRRLRAEDFTAVQKKEYAELNRQKASLLKKRIMLKLNGKFYVH